MSENTIRDFAIVAENDVLNGTNESANVYSGLSQGDKARARNTVKNAMENAMRNDDFDAAKSYLAISNSLVSVKAEKTPIDQNAVIANRILSLRYAADLIESGATIPDGIDADSVDFGTVAEMVTNAETETTSTVVAESGTKIGRNAARRDVAAHIESAMADLAPGSEILVSAIHNHRSDAYGDDAPSSGAIFARFVSWSDKSDLPDYVAAWTKNTDGKMVAVRA